MASPRYSGGRSQRYAAEFGTKTETVSPEEKAAQAAGFSSVSEQTQNRIMRNQLEEKATRLGVPLADAYALAGSDLTNTQALQEAWNSLTGPAPPPPVHDPAPDPPKDPQEELLEKYRAESKAYMDAAQKKLQDTQNEMLQQQKAAQLQRQLAIESQKYSQQQAQIQAERQAKSSAERGGAQASLKIASDSKQTGGTSAFKRRRDQMSIYPLQTTAGINAPARSVLNI